MRDDPDGRALENVRLFTRLTLWICCAYGLLDVARGLPNLPDLVTILAVGLMDVLLHSPQVRARHAQALALVVAAIVLASIAVDYLLGYETNQDSLLQLVLLSLGVALLSQPNYLATAAVCMVVWWALRPYGPAGPATRDEILTTLGAAVMGWLCLLDRCRLDRSLRERGTELAEQRALLQQSLEESRHRRTRLDEQVEQQSRDLSQTLERLDRTSAERAELHDNLLHAHRVAAVGRLAGGVAHLVNNKLTVILGSLQVYAEETALTESDRAVLAELESSLEGAAELASRLLAVSGAQVYHLRPIRVSALLADSGPLARLLPPGVAWSQLIDCPDASVAADPSAFCEVLENLVSNAGDANQGRGRVELRVESSGGEVVFSVSDQGPGLPEGLKNRIFEPFFTTKPAGAGTGLGLAIVATIVEAHRGRLELAEVPGGGACFRVLLPTSESASEPAPATPSAPVPTVPGGDETLVLVEDHDSVRVLAARFLERRGYRVLACSGASEALAALEKEPQAPALVVSDVMMPEMDGPALARVLLERRPDLRFLFVSGYADDALTQAGLPRECYHFLPKPYTLDRLACVIREQLDR